MTETQSTGDVGVLPPRVLPDSLQPFENRHGAHAGREGHHHEYRYAFALNLWVCTCGRAIEDERVATYDREKR